MWLSRCIHLLQNGTGKTGPIKVTRARSKSEGNAELSARTLSASAVIAADSTCWFSTNETKELANIQWPSLSAVGFRRSRNAASTCGTA